MDVLSLGYPLGDKLSAGCGKIINIKEYEFEHNIPTTEKGSSGSPIILFNLLTVIGIHKYGDLEKKINVGTFIGKILNEINNDLEGKKSKNDKIADINIKENINDIKNKPEQRSVLRSNNSNIYQSLKGIFCTQTFTGYNKNVVSLIQLNSGKIASGSYDNTIRLWDFAPSKEEKIINEKEEVIALLEFEYNKILCGTKNNEVNLWDLNSDDKECLFSFKGHELWVNCLVKCNNYYFATASNDSYIKIWDYYNRMSIRTLKGHENCVLALIILKNNN